MFYFNIPRTRDMTSVIFYIQSRDFAIMTRNDLIWHSEVRDYEVDYQGIVNNANYFNYFSYARAVYLKTAFDVDLKKFADKGINIVLLKTEISFRMSLTLGDSFYVITDLFRMSKFKFKCIQKILLGTTDKVVTEAGSVIATITKDKKPYIMQEFANVSSLDMTQVS